MESKPWHQFRWPEGVPKEISGYQTPLYALLDESAKEYPTEIYTLYKDHPHTFLQTQQTAEQIAHYLTDLGIKPGDRVAIFLPNLPHFVSIFFGILKTGAVCVTCNPLYTAEELNFQLKDCGARLVFCMDHPQFYPTTVEAIANTDVEEVIICNAGEYLSKEIAEVGNQLGLIPKADNHQKGHRYFHEIQETALKPFPNHSVDPDTDPAMIIYTGGTTGRPKGAVLSHSNVSFAARVVDEYARLYNESNGINEKIKRAGAHCFLGILPWYHSFGLITSMLWSCVSGNKLICIPDPRAGDPPFTEALESVQNHKVSILPAVPTIFVALTNHPQVDQYDLTSIIACPSGGAPLPVEVAQRYEAKTKAVIFEGYGLSENGAIACINPTALNTRKIGTVGFPVCNTDVKFVDLETGLVEMPPGEDGEVAIAGPQVMLNYWKQKEENEAVFREINGKRYLLTGDIGHLDNEGYVVITDRKKDMILVGGFNVYPCDVEEILFKHPKIALAAVVGVPNDKGSEDVKAYVQLIPGETATESDIKDYCEQHLTGYKRPRQIEFRQELPTSIIGKVLRRKLRDEAPTG